jgi:hypothetical protein
LPSKLDTRPIEPQPLSAFRVGRHHPIHLIPESLCVVGVDQVGELVDDDVIEDRWRGDYAFLQYGHVTALRRSMPALLHIEGPVAFATTPVYTWRCATTGGMRIAPFPR